MTDLSTLRTGTGLEVWVYDILHGPSTNLISYIPNCTNVTYEDQLNDVGAGSVTINTTTIPNDSTVFAKDNIWVITWNGLKVFAFIAENVQDVQVPWPRQRTVAGRGLGQWLDKAKSYPAGWGQAGVIPTPTQVFTNVTMAGIIKTLLDQAQARGTLPWISRLGWSATVDSSANSWSDSNNLNVDVGTSLLTSLQTYQKACPLDWHVDANGALSLWKKAGKDLTGAVRIQPVGSMLSAELVTDNTNLFDVVLVEDANQGFTEQVDTPTINNLGRREQFTSSSTVVDSTGRADLGYSLLQTYKTPVIQKVVQFDPTRPGRRPYIDYNLGDTITIEFPDGSTAPARVIAIALGTSALGGTVAVPPSALGGTATVTASGHEEGADGAVGATDLGTILEQVLVTLDFTLGQNQQATTLDSSAITNGGAPVTVFVQNDNALTVGTSGVVYLSVTIQTWDTDYAVCTVSIEGTLSAQATITANVVFPTGTIRSLQEVKLAGPVTWTPTFLIPAMPSGQTLVQLQVSVSTGSLSVPLNQMQMWFTGPGLSGGGGNTNTDMNVIDTIPFGAATSPYTVSTTASLALQTPKALVPSSTTPVSVGGPTGWPVINTNLVDALDGQAKMLAWGFTEVVAAGADDGSDNSQPVWTNSATQLETGNDGGIIYGFYCRFVIPAPSVASTSVTVSKAILSGVVDQTDNNASLIIYAEKAASPTQITSDADYRSRTMTTASVTWSPGSVVSGNPIQAPDLSPILQELVTAYGNTITAIQLFVKDNGSPTNGKLEIRSVENTANQPPQLAFQWHT